MDQSSQRPVVEIPVVGITVVEVSPDGKGDVVIGFETGADADIRIKFSPMVLAELEAMLAQANAEQAKHQPVQ